MPFAPLNQFRKFTAGNVNGRTIWEFYFRVCCLHDLFNVHQIYYRRFMYTHKPKWGKEHFIFFQCLAYQVFVTNIFVDFCGASVKRDKAIRITEKMEKLLSYPNGVQATKWNNNQKSHKWISRDDSITTMSVHISLLEQYHATKKTFLEQQGSMEWLNSWNNVMALR